MKELELIVIYKKDGFMVDVGMPQSKSSFYYDEQLLHQFLLAPYKTLLFLGFQKKPTSVSPSFGFLYQIAQHYIEKLRKYSAGVADNSNDIQENTVLSLSKEETLELLHTVPFVIGIEFVTWDWITGVWDKLNHILEKELLPYDNNVDAFLTTHSPDLHLFGKVIFHLVENKSEAYPFAFLATYSKTIHKKEIHTPLKNALEEYKDHQEQLLHLLSAVSTAAEKSSFISDLMENGELFYPLQFTKEDAYRFFVEIPLYEESGVLCRIPNWWRKKTNRLKVSVTIGDKQPSQVGLEALITFQPKLFLGDDEISKEEVEALLSQSAGLSFIKGKWVEVDHEKLKKALEAFEKAVALSQDEEITLSDAMRMELQLDTPLKELEEDIETEFTNGQWLSLVREKMQSPEILAQVTPGDDFKATLRHYQMNGFQWLTTMKALGFGAMLADDMGLGKTVQILAFLEYQRKQKKEGKYLLVLPASLMGNWAKEIERFAPKLAYKIIHSTTKKDTDFLEPAVQLYITTYGMVRRFEQFQKTIWDIVILDEAQAIKNPSTTQTKSIKTIQGQFKIAMTGTPIENRLSDLWSLFDFLNKGLLGNAKEFTNFTKVLKEKNDYNKLRTVVNPFILRRLKTDKTIISDLPDKIEMKSFTNLSKKQVVLYKNMLDELKKSLEETEGISRKGAVLAAISKFKQICNHPDQFLGQTEYLESHSGKFEMLAEICETIAEKRERLLVFTQFKEMTQPIANYLETIFGKQGLVLHGGTPVKKRTEYVEQFCGEAYVPFMVLSLKAGGVGLNLTKANHVIHFDRWWNPAVEQQATDRAFRIGQDKNVFVYKFITLGTIEEKIDNMIEEKQKLSGDILATAGENWITEMNNEDLIQLFSLEG